MRVRQLWKCARFTRCGLIALACSLLLGCAVPLTPARTVYEDPTNFVRVETDTTVFRELPHTLHSHPFRLTTDQMARILKGLKVQEHRAAIYARFAGEAPKVQAFRDDEIAFLAPLLSEALAAADPTERVAFYMSEPKTSIKRVITTGGLYVRGQELHFIMGNYRLVYGIPAYGMVYDRRYPIKPIAAKGFDLFFEPPEPVIPQSNKIWDQLMGRVKDEVLIDLERLFATHLVDLRNLPADRGR